MVTRVSINAAAVIVILAAIYFATSKMTKAKSESVKPMAPATSVAPAAHPATSSGVSTNEPASPGRVHHIDADTRQRLLAQIAAARAKRGESSSAVPGTPGAPHEFTAEYIQAQMHELVPLIKDCYEKQLVDDPHLGGTLMVEFTIGGEPDVGGVIEDSAINAENSTIANPSMIECVRETVLALEFDPPAQGGKVVVHYPFAFTADAPRPN